MFIYIQSYGCNKSLLRNFKCIIYLNQTNLKDINTITDLKQLWMHETLRVFYDRIDDINDKTYFIKLLSQ